MPTADAQGTTLDRGTWRQMVRRVRVAVYERFAPRGGELHHHWHFKPCLNQSHGAAENYLGGCV